MECQQHKIKITLCLPPDTGTPGFENENRTKPLETKLLSEAGGLVQPQIVAKQLLSDAMVTIYVYILYSIYIKILILFIKF